jgi:hypothetical protein
MSVDGLGVYGWKAIVWKVGESNVVLLDYRSGFRGWPQRVDGSSISYLIEVKME